MRGVVEESWWTREVSVWKVLAVGGVWMAVFWSGGPYGWHWMAGTWWETPMDQLWRALAGQVWSFVGLSCR